MSRLIITNLTTKTRSKIITDLPRKKVIRVKVANNLILDLNRHTLVPHPNTYRLIELAKKLIEKDKTIKIVVDPGTGSGIIAISLAKSFPQLKVCASDVSRPTLRTAKKNAKLNKVGSIKFFENRFGTDVWLKEFNHHPIDLIVANPPFIGIDEYNSPKFFKNWPEAFYEPLYAILTSDPEGLAPFLRIFENAFFHKSKYILFECNSLNMAKLKRIFRPKATHTKTFNDQEGNKRFMLIKLK